jgi:NAD(P)-dependent dehydrogenase (short-subunit alcohol dehydrogenase family)
LRILFSGRKFPESNRERNFVNKTVLITGTSSGIGRETALYFASKGWNVVATMRNPESRQTDLKGRDHIDCVHLDALDMESVRKAVNFARDKFGSIDVIVNNAGFATLGPFEASKREQVQKQFNTNVIGLVDLTKEIIPVFRTEIRHNHQCRVHGRKGLFSVLFCL